MDSYLNKTLALPSYQWIEFISIDEIAYLMARGNYTIFCLNSAQEIMVSKTIKAYEDVLPPDSFFRAHQSYIVNREQVKRYSKPDSSVMLSSGVHLPVAKRRRTEFLEWLSR